MKFLIHYKTKARLDTFVALVISIGRCSSFTVFLLQRSYQALVKYSYAKSDRHAVILVFAITPTVLKLLTSEFTASIDIA